MPLPWPFSVLIYPTQPHPLTPPNVGPSIPCLEPPGSRQKLPDKDIQDKAAAEAGERRWQALQVEAESVKGQKGWCICVVEGGSAMHTLRHPQAP